jgi:hypothetical protein
MKENIPGAAWGLASSGAAVLAATLLAAPPASAADLPLKASVKAVEFNPFWAEADALAWGVKGGHLPALVTTSPVGTPLASAGVLGLPTTTVLFGNSSVNDDWRAGGRLTAGYWFDPSRSRGIEASFFGLGDVSTGFAANSGITSIIARPFLDATANLQNAAFVSFPGVTTGSIAINERSRLLGAGALYRQDIGMWAGQRITALVGYRYLRSSDDLSISSQSTIAGGGFGGGAFAVNETFGAVSQFHGLDLGLAGEWRNGPWSLEWRGKVALGGNFNSGNINGATVITAGGVAATTPGGVLTQPGNIGNFSQTRFAAVPEVSLKAGYQIAPRWQLIAGYDALYWTGVQRAGGLIDTTVNPNLIPGGAGGGPNRPMPLMNTTSLWAQGFSFGVRYNY